MPLKVFKSCAKIGAALLLGTLSLSAQVSSSPLALASPSALWPKALVPGVTHTVRPNDPAAVVSRYADMLGVGTTSLANSGLYRFIDEWYGVRYRFGGTSKSGIDCSAFVRELYSKVFGMSLVRTAMQQAASCCRLFTGNDLKEGDLVFFKVGTSRISHVGVYLTNDKFVHASSSRGVMISSLGDKYWKQYYAGGGRML